MNISYVGEGKVYLLSGGGKIFTDVAARFVGSERSLDEIVVSEYNKKLVENIINRGHLAATEFDYFIFGVEGYSRVTETQLVRKRIASYLIKSGRAEKNGKRKFDIVLPESVTKHSISYRGLYWDYIDILELIEDWYNSGITSGFKEEELRYLKPQATEFKGIIGMNCHALIDWFKIRLCLNAQTEIQDMAWKMFKLVTSVAPDLFSKAGPNCKALGYCPENGGQHKSCVGKVLTHDKVLTLIKNNS